jgi:phospholipase/carboxylesterase
MIMLHGWNAGPRNILELAEPLAHPGFAFLAPGAHGGTWYPLSFLAPTDGNEPFLSSALGVVDALIDTVEEQGTPGSRIVLLGFSQGACLALTAAARRQAGSAARRLGGVIGFSGGLIGPVGVTWNYAGDFQAAPVLLGCSDGDPHIPRERVEETARVFEGMGARVTLRLYPGMGHFVNDEELDLARGIMREVAERGSVFPPGR